MNAGRRFVGRGVLVLAVLALAGATVSRAAYFQADLDALYYTDGTGRTLNWDLSAGTANANGVVTIPPASYTLPAAEAGAVLTLEPDGGLMTKTFGSGVYRMGINQATPGIAAIPTAAAPMTIDGSAADWGAIAVFDQDATGDVWWPGVPTGADVEYVKLAYSPDLSKLYILYKLTENVNTSLWYRLFVNKNLGEHQGGLGVFQIDLQYGGAQWGVVSQGYTTDDDDSWYILANDNGVAAASGQYVEAQVDTAPFGLPARVNAFGRSMLGVNPYMTFDEFDASFQETEGGVYLNGDDNITLPASASFTTAARIRNFANYAFEGTSPYLRFAGVSVSNNSREGEGNVEPEMEAYWITGDFDGTEVDNALVIMANVEKWTEDEEYWWEWSPVVPGGGGVVLEGLDPATTVVDLKFVVSNGGQTVTFYYRTNSAVALDSATGWIQATAHTLPPGTGTMYGAPETTPMVELETGFNRAAPVYRLYNQLNGKHFFTIDRAEKNYALATWPWAFVDEGIKYYTYAEDSQPGTLPVYRFWSEALGTHFYTIDEAEKNRLVNDEPFKWFWALEGPAFYAWAEGSQPAGAKAVYRFWNNGTGSHFYTASTSERDKLLTTPASWFWAYEGVAFYTLESLFNDD
jgi:hypothetical protein